MSLTSKQSVAQADALQREVERVIEGAPLEQVISVCGTLWSQAIADASDTPEIAAGAVRVLANAIVDDIRKNWHLVTTRRKRQ